MFTKVGAFWVEKWS